MGCNHAPGLLAVQSAQDGLGNGSANLRFRTRAHFVDEQQGAGRSIPQEQFHVGQMGRIGREVVVDALLVADVNQDVVIDGAGGIVAHGNRQSALEHILHEAEGFETDALAACIGAGDEDDALSGIDGNVEWHHAFAFRLIPYI